MPVSLVYLEGHPRLSRGNEWDFYFVCNVQGPDMQWVINGTNYGSFFPGQLQVVGRESLPDFNYTTTLLSSRTIGAGVHQLDSILIVSVVGNITIDVGCVSDTGSDFSNNRKTSTSQVLQTPFQSPVIRMVQLWKGDVVQGEGNTTTTCLLCEVNYSNQFWETSNGNLFGFDNQNNIGSALSLPSTNNIFMRLQTILIDKPPQRLISIFLLSDSSVSHVNCSANGNSVSSAQLSRIQNTSGNMDLTTPDVTTPDVTTPDVTAPIVDTKHTFEAATEGKLCQFQ